ncbi:MAG TPA: sulfatase-like hydrolase/transferase, partial [Sphingobacteriaceae bacterium]
MMLKSALVLFRFFIFWMIFFFLDRLIFILYFNEKTESADSFELFLTFLNGLRLDASTAIYLSAIPLLVYVVVWILRIRLPVWIPRVYVHIMITVLSFISIVNFNVYREWGGKISYRILDFLITSPKEAIASSSSSPITSSFVIFFILIICALWISGKIIDYELPKQRVALWLKIPAALFFIALAGLIARGGWQLSPINQSMAYFSEKTILNHAAINTEWNLIHDVINNKYIDDNPYQYLPAGEAKEKMAQIYPEENGPAINILKNQRPNVIFIILESFTGNLVESLGGEKGIAPKMEKLISDGVFFNNVYASGDRTDRGLVAILSGFPSQAIRSIMKQNGKQEKLPGIGSALGSSGYKTSFYYGGESEFFNLKSYVLSHGYTHLVDKRAFSGEDMNSKWGAYDHVVYQKFISEMMQPQEPFFSTILTLTNHEPFELPTEPQFGNNTVEDQFRSTAFYTDSALYD